MTRGAIQAEARLLGSSEVADMVQRAQEKMAELDAALQSIGSPRKPEKRIDRAPVVAPSTPIYNPTVLSY